MHPISIEIEFVVPAKNGIAAAIPKFLSRYSHRMLAGRTLFLSKHVLIFWNRSRGGSNKKKRGKNERREEAVRHRQILPDLGPVRLSSVRDFAQTVRVAFLEAGLRNLHETGFLVEICQVLASYVVEG